MPQVLGKPTAEVTWVQPMTAEVAVAGIATDQMFLVFTTVYILIPTLMVFLLLVLRPRVNRIVNIVVALFCAVGILSPHRRTSTPASVSRRSLSHDRAGHRR
ncbi:MAG: hypothetical protein WCH74_07465 [Chloroflexota bacterium]